MSQSMVIWILMSAPADISCQREARDQGRIADCGGYALTACGAVAAEVTQIYNFVLVYLD